MTSNRVVRLLGRLKAYRVECQESMSPMPDPPLLKKEEEEMVVTFERLRKIPTSTHTSVIKSAWKSYLEAWKMETSSGQRKRREEEQQKSKEALEGMMKEAENFALEKTEDMRNTKQALGKLMGEVKVRKLPREDKRGIGKKRRSKDSRYELKQVAEDKLDVIKESLAEFAAGYREERNKELKRIVSMEDLSFSNFLEERFSEVHEAASMIMNGVGKDDKSKATTKSPATSGSKEEDQAKAGGEEGKEGVPSRRGAESATVGKGSGDTGDEEGLLGLLSAPVREATKATLNDPDVKELTGRAGEFLKGRMQQAEEAGKTLKEIAADGKALLKEEAPLLNEVIDDTKYILKDRVANAEEAVKVLLSPEDKDKTGVVDGVQDKGRGKVTGRREEGLEGEGGVEGGLKENDDCREVAKARGLKEGDGKG
ncbi:unnamed protein product [Choristocarpus tenellus]